MFLSPTCDLTFLLEFLITVPLSKVQNSFWRVINNKTSVGSFEPDIFHLIDNVVLTRLCIFLHF